MKVSHVVQFDSISSCGPLSLGYLCKVPPSDASRPHSSFASASRFDSVILVRFQALRLKSGGLPTGGTPSHVTRSPQRSVFGAGVDRLSLGDRGRRFESVQNPKGFCSSAVRARSDRHNTPRSIFGPAKFGYLVNVGSIPTRFRQQCRRRFRTSQHAQILLRLCGPKILGYQPYRNPRITHTSAPFCRAEAHRLSKLPVVGSSPAFSFAGSSSVGRTGAIPPMFDHTPDSVF